ncbi:DUF6783 domain-containing protein [uncultured Robinsoniella sp.]
MRGKDTAKWDVQMAGMNFKQDLRLGDSFS